MKSYVSRRPKAPLAVRRTDLTKLYVTTATKGWSDEQRRAEPAAGLVYRFDTDTTGCPAAPFRPEPTWWAHMSS